MVAQFSSVGGPGACISAAFTQSGRFLLCIYIGDWCTLVAFLVLKCLCFCFLGYLVGKFSKFCGGMQDLERDKIFQHRLFRRLSNCDSARWL